MVCYAEGEPAVSLSRRSTKDRTGVIISHGTSMAESYSKSRIGP